MTRCYHCHEPVPPGSAIEALVDGEPRPMCCHGCAAVASLIDDSGLTAFYRLRTAPAARPEASDSRWEIFDREDILEAVTDDLGDGRRELLCAVPAVNCAACSWLIESALADLPGLDELTVNPATRRLRAVYRPEALSLSSLLARLDAIGYRPQPLTPDALLAQQRAERRGALRRVLVGGVGMMQVMMYAVALYAGYFEGMEPATRDFLRLFSLIMATPVVFYAGWPFFAGAWRGLRRRRPGMDLPVALAVGAAYGASAWNTFTGGAEVYFDSAVMFVFFLSLARWTEMRLRHRAFELGLAAGEELPQHALRLAAGGWERVALASLAPGDRVRVGAGETIPADGRLLDTSARVDESLLTGEARPVHRAAGEPLVAGSVLVDGPVEIEVQRTGRETLLSSIRRLLERARAVRPRQIAQADRLAGWLVSGIVLLAAATWVWWLGHEAERAFEVALAVLVITCPCALSLATPTALSAAATALMRRGVLLVSGSALEPLARTTRVVFDKTGTLTTGRMSLAAGRRCGDLPAERCLAIAAALERGTRHPIASAFEAASSASLEAEAIRSHPGLGVEGRVEGRRYRLGRPDFVAELSGQPSGLPGSAVEAPVLLGDERGLLASYELREELRPDAGESLARLGLPVSLLSGDGEGPVRRLAGRLGIAEARWRQQPGDKLAFVSARQAAGEVIAMVGDGSNDAPVLAGADVSIAIGQASAMANRQADVIMLSGRLATLPETLALARRTRRIVRQNLAWALGYNLLAVPAAAAGLVPPWLAAIGMSGSSLLVLGNSLRLLATPEHGLPPKAGARLREAPA